MTRATIRKAFEKLDTATQAELLGELATTFAKNLSDVDRQDAGVFEKRRSEERKAKPLSEVKERLTARKRR